MAENNDSTLPKEKLLAPVTGPDPLLSMLEWPTSPLMRIGAEGRPYFIFRGREGAK